MNYPPQLDTWIGPRLVNDRRQALVTGYHQRDTGTSIYSEFQSLVAQWSKQIVKSIF